ncbi:Uncharacterized protein OBRU01_22676, partial [Operophtera brumata]
MVPVVRRIELSASSSRATFYLTGRAPAAPRHACLSVHAVGPRVDTRPAHVRLLDYYRPTINDTQVEDCPARIAHDSSQDIKDNIFNEARSLLDSSEILINHEYDFEDIPEGIPLDDPLYENLTIRNVTDDITKAETNNSSTINRDAYNNNDDFINDTNSINKLIIVNKDEKTANKYNNNSVDAMKTSTGSNVVVIDDKLDLSEENNHRLKLHGNIELENSTGSIATSADNVIQDEERKRNENIISAESFHLNTNAKVTLEEQSTKSEADNVTTKEPSEPNHRIEIRDGQHENHREVENPNLAGFHVISSDKDLDVPTGIEGPVSFVVAPPPNFIPPPNMRAPVNNPETQNNAATFEKFDPNSQTRPTQKEATIYLHSVFSPNSALPSHILPPPHNFAQYYEA